MTIWPNWIDLTILILVFRGCYVGLSRGILAELLGFVGAVSVTTLTMNYWNAAVMWVDPWWRWDRVLKNFLVFWLLFLIGILIVRFLIKRVTQVIKWERLHWMIQGVGLMFGGARGLWWSGFLLLALTSSGISYLQNSVEQRSVLGPTLLAVSQQTVEQIADWFPGAQNRGKVLIPPFRVSLKKS